MNLEQLRAFCLSLPGTTEDVKWGADLCFLIGEKMFCVTSFEEPVGLSLKVSDADFDALTERDGIRPAAYLARYKWVYIEDLSTLRPGELEDLIRKSYELIKSKLPAGKKAAGKSSAKKSAPKKKAPAKKNLRPSAKSAAKKSAPAKKKKPAPAKAKAGKKSAVKKKR